jgi:hypothetical protein
VYNTAWRVPDEALHHHQPIESGWFAKQRENVTESAPWVHERPSFDARATIALSSARWRVDVLPLSGGRRSEEG